MHRKKSMIRPADMIAVVSTAGWVSVACLCRGGDSSPTSIPNVAAELPDGAAGFVAVVVETFGFTRGDSPHIRSLLLLVTSSTRRSIVAALYRNGRQGNTAKIFKALSLNFTIDQHVV